MKALLVKVTTTTPLSADLGLLIIRVWFGLVMAFAHGWGKMFGDTTKMVAKLDELGFPAPALMASLAGLSEFVAALLLAIGLLSRLAAIPLAFTMVIAAFVIHGSDPWMKQEFPLLYACAAIAILVSGPGRFSVDHALRKRLAGPDDTGGRDR